MTSRLWGTTSTSSNVLAIAMLPSTSVTSPRPRKSSCLLYGRLGVRVAQSQQSLLGAKILNIVQEQLRRFLLEFLACGSRASGNTSFQETPPPQRAAPGECNDVQYMQDLFIFLMGPVVHTTVRTHNRQSMSSNLLSIKSLVYGKHHTSFTRRHAWRHTVLTQKQQLRQIRERFASTAHLHLSRPKGYPTVYTLDCALAKPAKSCHSNRR